jgi:hypothetical protein
MGYEIFILGTEYSYSCGVEFPTTVYVYTLESTKELCKKAWMKTYAVNIDAYTKEITAYEYNSFTISNFRLSQLFNCEKLAICESLEEYVKKLIS